MLHLRDMGQYIIGYFKSQQKDTFCQGNLHRDKASKCKNDQKRNYRGHLKFSKKSKITFKRWKLRELWPVQVGKFWANAWSANWAAYYFGLLGHGLRVQTYIIVLMHLTSYSCIPLPLYSIYFWFFFIN